MLPSDISSPKWPEQGVRLYTRGQSLSLRTYCYLPYENVILSLGTFLITAPADLGRTPYIIFRKMVRIFSELSVIRTLTEKNVKLTRTATHSCRNPETRMSFLVVSWRPPQAAACRGCRRYCEEEEEEEEEQQQQQQEDAGMWWGVSWSYLLV